MKIKGFPMKLGFINPTFVNREKSWPSARWAAKAFKRPSSRTEELSPQSPMGSREKGGG